MTKRPTPIKELKPAERATELEFLKYFYQWADFGPATGDVNLCIKERFMNDTGKNLPKGYEIES